MNEMGKHHGILVPPDCNGDNVHGIYFNVRSSSFSLSLRPDTLLSLTVFFFIRFWNTYVARFTICSMYQLDKDTSLIIKKILSRTKHFQALNASSNCIWHKFQIRLWLSNRCANMNLVKSFTTFSEWKRESESTLCVWNNSFAMTWQNGDVEVVMPRRNWNWLR